MNKYFIPNKNLELLKFSSYLFEIFIWNKIFELLYLYFFKLQERIEYWCQQGKFPVNKRK